MSNFSEEFFKELEKINAQLNKNEPMTEEQSMTLLLASLIEEEGNGGSTKK